ncbi:MAG: hypothetical protein Q9187_009168, partial [Circinaria calcarea]
TRLTDSTKQELLQKIEPTVRGSLNRYELTAEDGQLVTEENWSKRAEQEEPSRIRLTLTRKVVPSYSEREDTESDERSSETSSNISKQWHKLREQSLRKTDDSNLIQPSHSEAPNSVESDESATSNPLTAFPPRSTQPSAIKGRPTVTFTTRLHSHEPSTPGETPLPVKSDSEANNEHMDTTIPDIPQSADSEKRGSTEYLSAVGLDENSTYSGRLGGAHGYRSKSSHYSARRVLYEEDDVVPITRYSRQHRRRIISRDRPRSWGDNFTSGGQASARPDDIYYTPPTVEKFPETPSITVAAASVPPEDKFASAEHVEAEIEEGKNPVPESPSDILRKGRRTPSERRPSSPGSAKPTVLPIFLWPIGQSSSTNAGEIAHEDTSGGKTDTQDSVPGFRSFEVNDDTLAKILDDADKRLKNSKKTNERKAYASVETKSLQEVDDTILRILGEKYTESTWDMIPPVVHEVDPKHSRPLVEKRDYLN